MALHAETVSQLLSNPTVKFIQMKPLLSNFEQMTTGMFMDTVPGVYIDDRISPLILDDGSIIGKTEDGEDVKVSIRDVVDDKINPPVDIYSKRTKKLAVPARFLNKGMFSLQPSHSAMAVETAMHMELESISDEYYTHWLSPSYANYLKEQYFNIATITDMADWYGPLSDRVDEVLEPYRYHIIKVSSIGYLLRLSIYCDYRVYLYTKGVEDAGDSSEG